MAPRLAPLKIQLICDMIKSNERISTTIVSQIANAAECSRQSIYYIRSNLQLFDSARAPLIRAGCRRIITPSMLEALCDHLLERPTSSLYLDEMAVFLQDEFQIRAIACAISRALASIKQSKKTAQQKAKERNADLRDTYAYYLSGFRSDHLVYVDESGGDKRILGFRRTGWLPLGVAPVQVSKFHRSQRYQILPAYAQDGIILSRVFQGSTNTVIFEDFIQQLLEHCGKWPEPKSVLMMDNASFHHSKRVEQMCSEAGVKLVYLLPYLLVVPDLNLVIKEFFAELKAFIKRNQKIYKQDPGQDFNVFLEWCVDTVGQREESAMGHFRHASLTIDGT